MPALPDLTSAMPLLLSPIPCGHPLCPHRNCTPKRPRRIRQPGRQKENWEDLYMYGMFGGFALFGVLYLYKPDSTVQTWALAEAVSAG